MVCGYDLVTSEMWFTFKRWIDPVVKAILINPIISPAPLQTQLTSRRWRPIRGGRRQVEAKVEYKNRNNGSPDEADSCIMAPQLLRARGHVLPGLVEQEDYSDNSRKEDHKNDYQDPAIQDNLPGVDAGYHESLED
jgi:hypothetical protein